MILMTQGDQLPADAHRNLETVLLSCAQLRRMILTFSYLSQIQSAGFELQWAETSADGLVNKAVEAMAGYAEMQKKRLLTETSAPNPLRVDVVLLDLALQNAIANGLARVRGGGEVRVRSCEKAGGVCEISIEEAGPVISAEFRDAMFDAAQVDRIKRAGLKTDRALGLVLFKRVAELHRGSVGIESSETQTRIWMFLPVKRD